VRRDRARRRSWQQEEEVLVWAQTEVQAEAQEEEATVLMAAVQVTAL
jgi:hypothetical protein